MFSGTAVVIALFLSPPLRPPPHAAAHLPPARGGPVGSVEAASRSEPRQQPVPPQREDPPCSAGEVSALGQGLATDKSLCVAVTGWPWCASNHLPHPQSHATPPVTCHTPSHLPHPQSPATPPVTCHTPSHLPHPHSPATPPVTCHTHSHLALLRVLRLQV